MKSPRSVGPPPIIPGATSPESFFKKYWVFLKYRDTTKNHGQIRDRCSSEMVGLAGHRRDGCCGIGIWLVQLGGIFQTGLVIPLG